MQEPFLIDAHSHIPFRAFKDDAAEVIARAEGEGIWQIAVGSQIDTSRRAVEYAEQYPHIWAVVGLHPTHLVREHVDWNEVGDEGKEGVAFHTRVEVFDPAVYRALAQHPKTVGIGECGMDFYRLPFRAPPAHPFAFSHENAKGDDASTVIRRMQEETFRTQIALAQECGLPLMVHVRDTMTQVHTTPPPAPPLEEGERQKETAHEATLRILGDAYGAWDGKQSHGMIHCYSGTWEQAQRYLGLGFNISFTGVITFAPTKKQLPIVEELWRTVRGVPLHRFHVETDCPYLTPEPHRGERNEPRYVRHVAESVAQLRGESLQTIAAASVENTLRLFPKMANFDIASPVS